MQKYVFLAVFLLVQPCLGGNDSNGRQAVTFGEEFASPEIVSVAPAANALDIPVDETISVLFDADMDPTTINDSTFVVMSRFAGKMDGIIGYNGGSRSATFIPSAAFDPGDVISVYLSTAMAATGGVALADAYTWTFHIAAQPGSGSFSLYTNISNFDNPSGATLADVNNDGNLDLIATNSGTSIAPKTTISVRYGDGHGSFGAQMVYSVGIMPYIICVGDLNGDGFVDLVTPNWHSNDISVLLNLGNGTFGTATSYPSDSATSAVCMGDFNGDGNMDVASANFGIDNICIYFGQGEGSLQYITTYAVGDQPYYICAADVSGDGIQDIVTANRVGNSISVLLNSGSGTFAPQAIYSTYADPHAIVAVDLDADGDLDLATADYQGNGVTVLKNYGDGTFYVLSHLSAGTNPHSVFAGDFDGDGDIDLATANDGSSNVSVLLNSGSGSFAPQKIFPSGGYPSCVTGGDLDGDADMDLVVANGRSNNVSVLLNQDPPQVIATVPDLNALHVPWTTNISAEFDQAMLAGDISPDNIHVRGSMSGPASGSVSYNSQSRTVGFSLLDYIYASGEQVTASLDADIRSGSGVAMGRGYAWTFTVDAGTSSGNFEKDTTLSAGDSVISVIAADVDRDGDLDLVSAGWGSNAVWVQRNNGNGGFAIAEKYTTGRQPYVVRAADLNGDRYLDLITADEADAKVSILLNNAGTSFASRSTYNVLPDPLDVCPFDIDGDGDVDLIMGHHHKDSLSLLRNNGNGTFLSYLTYAAGDSAFSVVAADLDRDGDLDVATANRVTGTVSILFNSGTGVLKYDTSYKADPGTLTIIAADFNEDGDMDLATANFEANNLTVLYNNGAGEFPTDTACHVGDKPYTLQAGDVDGDGHLDLIAANYGSNSISVLLSTGDGLFAPHVTYTTGTRPHSVVAADLDGDYDLDIATANNGSRSLSVFWNGTPFLVTSLNPVKHQLNVAPSTSIEATFTDAPMMASVGDSTFAVNGSVTGRHHGTFSFNDQTSILRYTGAKQFAAGEVVTAVLNESMKSQFAAPLENPTAWSFTIESVAGAGQFPDRADKNVGSSPRSVFAGDVNGDALPDIISANQGDDNVTIMLNNGDSTFSSGDTYAAGDGPYYVAVADLSGDFKADLVVANYSENSISVLMGNGNGTFMPQTKYTAGGSPYSLTVADLDNDGDLDVAVANRGIDSLSVFMNNGDGTLAAQIRYYSTLGNTSICAGDIDNDGYLDLILGASYYNYISVLRNDGHGGFSDYSQHVIGITGINGITVADFDGDGAVDVAATVSDSSAVVILWNEAGSGFTQSIRMPTDVFPRWLCSGDFNGDGEIDLASANYNGADVSVFFNEGERTFAPRVDYGVGAEPHSVFSADLDRDGRLDLLTANTSSGSVTILSNRDPFSLDSVFNPPYVEEGAACTLSVGVTGTVDSVLLYYRQGGEITWSRYPASLDGAVYAAVVPASAIENTGGEYYFKGCRGLLCLTMPEIRPRYRPFQVGVNLSHVAGPVIPTREYTMIGIAHDPLSNTVHAIFENILGSLSDGTWRLGRFDADVDSYYTYAPTDSIFRGEGYWLWSNVGKTIITDGRSGAPDTTLVFGTDTIPFGAIYLKPGWNQIANPFAFPILWGDRGANGNIDGGLHAYVVEDTVGRYDLTDTLQPFCGYWVQNLAMTPETLYVPYRRSAYPRTAVRKTMVVTEWRATLMVRSGGAADYDNHLGVKLDAGDGIDSYDFGEPPCPPGRFVSLSFENRDNSGRVRSLTTDYRAGGSVMWTFIVNIRGNTGQSATLTLADVSGLPEGYVLVLEDAVSGRLYRLKEDIPLSLPRAVTADGDRYRLIVAEEAYFDGQNFDITIIPDDFALGQNYPNPFNAATIIQFALPEPQWTRIHIYNVLGQLVAAPLDAMMPAGNHTVRWDGRDRRGQTVGSGVYFYEIVTDKFRDRKKMVLLK